MKIKLLLTWLTILLMFSGCASTYKPIVPKRVNYAAHELSEGLSFSYRYDVLSESGNKKYAKREKKNSIKLVAVRLTNNSGSVINVSRDVSFFVGDSEIIPCSPDIVKNELKQGVAVYLLYLLLTPMNLYTYSNESSYYGNTTETKTYRIGLILGPGISIGNMAVAGTAIGLFGEELNSNYIMNQNIQPGETVYGFVGFKNIGYNPIKVELKK